MLTNNQNEVTIKETDIGKVYKALYRDSIYLLFIYSDIITNSPADQFKIMKAFLGTNYLTHKTDYQNALKFIEEYHRSNSIYLFC